MTNDIWEDFNINQNAIVVEEEISVTDMVNSSNEIPYLGIGGLLLIVCILIFFFNKINKNINNDKDEELTPDKKKTNITRVYMLNQQLNNKKH